MSAFDVLSYIISEALRERLNANKEFKKAAKNFSGRILTILKSDTNIPYVYKSLVEIKDGECINVRIVPPDEDVNADVVITMTVSTFEKLLRGEIGAVRAYITGKIKISGPKKKELMKRKGILTAINEEMRELILHGKAMDAVIKFFRRIATF